MSDVIITKHGKTVEKARWQCPECESDRITDIDRHWYECKKCECEWTFHSLENPTEDELENRYRQYGVRKTPLRILTA
jgi:ribosomal protein L37AE/L43A